MVKGKYVIIAMVGIGMTLAGFGWWVRYTSSQKVLAVWGPKAVVAIRTSQRAELLPILKASDQAAEQGLELTPDLGDADNPANDLSEKIQINPPDCPSETIHIGPSIDITKAPGLIHARHHLVHQKGFNWDAPREDGCTPEWTIALRFASDEKQPATMVLDFACNRAYLVERNVEVGMRPIIADALKQFLADFDTSIEKATDTSND